jgi:hypothetical protein
MANIRLDPLLSGPGRLGASVSERALRITSYCWPNGNIRASFWDNANVRLGSEGAHVIPVSGARVIESITRTRRGTWALPGRFALDPVDGMQDQLGGGLEMQLLFDTVAKGLDGGNGEPKVLGDLPSALALPQHAEHFQFTVA